MDEYWKYKVNVNTSDETDESGLGSASRII